MSQSNNAKFVITGKTLKKAFNYCQVTESAQVSVNITPTGWYFQAADTAMVCIGQYQILANTFTQYAGIDFFFRLPHIQDYISEGQLTMVLNPATSEKVEYCLQLSQGTAVTKVEYTPLKRDQWLTLTVAPTKRLGISAAVSLSDAVTRLSKVDSHLHLERVSDFLRLSAKNRLRGIDTSLSYRSLPDSEECTIRLRMSKQLKAAFKICSGEDVTIAYDESLEYVVIYACNMACRWIMALETDQQ